MTAIGAATPLQAPKRRSPRRWAALLALLVAVIYALIAAHVVTVIDGPDAQVAKDQMAFATPAVAAYLTGAVLLWRSDRRLVGALGALLQLVVIAMYLDVSSERQPAFEVWGVTIRFLQVALLVLLVLLSVRPAQGASLTESADGPTGTSASSTPTPAPRSAN